MEWLTVASQAVGCSPGEGEWRESRGAGRPCWALLVKRSLLKATPCGLAVPVLAGLPVKGPWARGAPFLGDASPHPPFCFLQEGP